MENYPPNSARSRAEHSEPKNVERVTSEEPIRRRKGVGHQFRSTFLAGDARTAMQYVVFGVLIPAAKDALAEAGSQGIERLIFGESRAKKRAAHPTAATGYVNYNRRTPIGTTAEPPRQLSRRARSQHDFDEVVLVSRAEAEEVIDRLFDIVSRYESATVADLYNLVGINPSHTDHKWGWTDVRGAGISRVRNGYLLDLPEPLPMD
jgi:hypothetical protein